MGSIQYYSDAAADDAAISGKSSENALPASWYSSQEMYEFERRAIFAKTWLLISHKSRLNHTGDWLRYTFANYDIIVTRDRTGAVNSFHNVCRHRAYPVIEKEGAGNSKILACRYHGWSYGLNGKLAKAPGYQEMNLEKDRNSLFRCHTKIDSNGFIWINLDAKENSEIPFVEHSSGVEERHAQVDTADYMFDTELKREDLMFNWKQISANSVPEQLKADFSTTSIYFFPNSSTTFSSKFIAIQKILPQSPGKTTKHFELYRHKHCSTEEWIRISNAYADAVKAEQDNNVAAYLPTTVRDVLKEHHKQEKAAGKEIRPCRPVMFGGSKQVDEDEELCAALACGPQKDVLAW